MPVGNDRLGAMVYGGVGEKIIHLATDEPFNCF